MDVTMHSIKVFSVRLCTHTHKTLIPLRVSELVPQIFAGKFMTYMVYLLYIGSLVFGIKVGLIRLMLFAAFRVFHEEVCSDSKPKQPSHNWPSFSICLNESSPFR